MMDWAKDYYDWKNVSSDWNDLFKKDLQYEM